MSARHGRTGSYRLSRHVAVHRRNGTVGMFNSRTSRKVVGGADLIELLRELALSGSLPIVPDTPAARQLVDLGFLVPVESSEGPESLAHLVCQARKIEGPSQLWFFVTEACNSTCAYCRQRAGRVKGHRGIPSDAIDFVTDLFFDTRNPDRPITVFFYGGEPLLDFGVVRRSHHAVQSRLASAGNSDVQYNLFTNGYRVTEEHVRWCRDKGVFVIVSADAPPELSGSVRVPVQAGLDIGVALKRTIDLLHEHGVPFGLSCVVGAHNAPFLPEIVEYFQQQWKPRNIYFIPAHRPPGAASELFANNAMVARKILEAHEVASESGLYVENIMRRLRPFVDGLVKLVDCGACGNRLVLFPDGRIGPCEGSYHHTEMRTDPHEGYLDDPVFTVWSGRTPFANEECGRCQALSICGGGCPLDALEHGGALDELDDRHCVVTRTLWSWLVDRVLERFAGQEQLLVLQRRDLEFLFGDVKEDLNLPARGESFMGEIDPLRLSGGEDDG